MPRKGYCKTCTYIKKHPRCGLNMMLLEGVPFEAVAKKFKGKAGGKDAIKRHKEAGHQVTRQLLMAKDIRDRNRGLELAACQEEIYAASIKAMKMALGEEPTPEKANLQAFGSCAGPAVKMIEVLAKVDNSKDDDTPGIDRAIARMKELRDGK